MPTGDAASESKLSDEVVNRKAADEALSNSSCKKMAADMYQCRVMLQVSIDERGCRLGNLPARSSD